MRSLIAFVCAPLALCSVLAHVAAAVTPQFQVHDIGSFGGSWTQVNDMNEPGVVVGWSYNSASRSHAFSYTPATGMVDLDGNAFSSTANAINEHGQIVGGIDSHAFIYTPGSGLLDIGTPSAQLNQASALDINEAGQVVGSARPFFSSPERAWIYRNGVMTNIDTIGSSSSAEHISETGRVVGTLFLPGYPIGRAFAYEGAGPMRDLGTLGGQATGLSAMNGAGQAAGSSSTAGDAKYNIIMLDVDGSVRDLGNLGGFYSFSNDINEAGHIVGLSGTTGNARISAFLYDGTTMHELPSLGGQTEAKAINNLDQVVGYSYVNGVRDAFYFDGTSMYDLNDLVPAGFPVHLEQATQINDAGYIVAQGSTADGGGMRSFLFTPVPEPAGIALAFGAGVTCLCRHRARRRQ